MQAVAKLRNCPTSPRKMRIVVDTIRNMEVEKALNVLRLSKKEASIRLEKLLLSAISNWQHLNEGVRLEESNLIVKTAFVDGGVTIKRFRPAPYGRAHRIRKRSNHVTLIVDSKDGIQLIETIESVDVPVKEEIKTKTEGKAQKAKEVKDEKQPVKKEAKAAASEKSEDKKATQDKAKEETKKKEVKAEGKKEATPKATEKKDTKSEGEEKNESKDSNKDKE